MWGEEERADAETLSISRSYTKVHRDDDSDARRADGPTFFLPLARAFSPLSCRFSGAAKSASRSLSPPRRLSRGPSLGRERRAGWTRAGGWTDGLSAARTLRLPLRMRAQGAIALSTIMKRYL